MRVPRTVSQGLLAVVMALAPAGTGSTATSTDAGAGNWQMIVLTGPTQFGVAPPAQVTGLEYQAELASIKNAQSRITADQQKAIDY